MESQVISVRQDDKTYTKVYVSYAKNNTSGSILLLHDMCEHHNRFNEFYEHLLKSGYDVFSFDYRGHGGSVKFEELGHIADSYGWQILVDDVEGVLQYIIKNNRSSRTLIYGQGIGACLALNAVSSHKDIDACVCSGIPGISDSKLNRNTLLANFIKKAKGNASYSPYLSEKLFSFPDFLKISDRTAFDWISRDNKAVGAYINDPLCGYVCTASYYADMLKIISISTSKKFTHRIRPEMPLLFISGSNDPVTNYGDSVVSLFDSYEHSLEKVDCIIYDECRHDLLHEINKNSIMKDITDWLYKMLYATIPAASAAIQAAASHHKDKDSSKTTAAQQQKKKAEGRDAAPVMETVSDDDNDENIKNLGFFGDKKNKN